MTKKFKISGPGAADFIAAPGGIDFPEVDPAKGMASTRDEPIINEETLEPALDPPDPVLERERPIGGAVPDATPPDATPPSRGGQRSE